MKLLRELLRKVHKKRKKLKNSNKKFFDRKRAQVFSSEVLIAYFIFSIAVIIFLGLWLNAMNEIKNSERFYSLEETVLDLGEKLIKTPGIPDNWTHENVLGIGLTQGNESRILSQRKILEFVKMMNYSSSYYKDKSDLLGIGKYDFYFNLTDINGTTLIIENTSCYTGKPPEKTVEIVTIKRTALLNNEIVRIIINVWYG